MTPRIPASLPGPASSPDPAGGSGDVPAALGPRHARPGPDRPQVWLPVAAAGLCALSAAAAAVSYAAQYRLVDAARHLPVAAGLEAAIPDAAALVFACLGVALALHGRRAVRARLLNAASAGASVSMNVIAAAPGWRNLAVWAMPPAAYALASDTLIGVVRAGALARRNPERPGGVAEVSFLAALGGLTLWLLRLCVAPRSTAAGFRRWVLEECPVAPGRPAPPPAPSPDPGRPGDDLPGGRTAEDRDGPRRPGRLPRAAARARDSKTSRFLALVAEEHGPLAAIPLASVARICGASAPRVGLHAGSARAALRRAVLAAGAGNTRDPQNEQTPAKGDR
jgi:hypothetical protein